MSPNIEIGALFEATAQAVRSAQLALDNQIIHYPDAAYTIPRVSVGTRVSVEKKGKATIEGRVGFELVTVPDPPPPGPDSTVIDESAAMVLLPPFLVQPAGRLRLFNLLKTALQDPQRHSFDFPEPVESTDLRVELELLDKAFRNTSDDSIAVVFLRLSAVPEKYLIVRLGSRTLHKDRDGIYVLDPAAEVPVIVYSFATSGQDSFYYAPFYLLFEMVRGWMAGGMSGAKAEVPGIPPQFGSLEIASTAAKLWEDYVKARRTLSSYHGPSSPFAPPVHYLLGTVDASLALSQPRDDKPDEPPLIRSRAAIRIEQKAVSAGVYLVAPEFILTESSRDSLLDIVQETEDLVTELDVPDGYVEYYAAAFADAARRRTAQVFLSYRGGEPQDEFLVIWRGNLLGKERDFAFTCSVDDDELSDLALVLHLEDPREESSQRPFSEAQMNRKQYVGIHNFFHSIRIWDMSGKWFPPA